MIKKLVLITLFFSGSCLFPMDRPIFSESWINLAGGILIGTVTLKAFLSYIHSSQPQESFNFNGLPEDVRLIIIDLLTRNSYSQTLTESTYTINSLAQVNKQLNTLLNKPEYCMQMIKHLSQRFACSNEMVAKALNLKAAQERIQLQKALDKEHIEGEAMHPSAESLDILIKNGIDLDFTYGLYGMTPLQMCLSKAAFGLATLLITKGANVNAATPSFGYTILMRCCEVLNVDMFFNFFKYLIKLPQININQKNNEGETAFNIFLSYIDEMDPERVIEIINLFLKAGADPGNPNNNGILPLDFIKKHLPNEKIIEIMEEAIQKKHSQ